VPPFALAVALAAFAACGGEEQPKPDREQVREVVTGFFRAVAKDDVEAICDELTGAGRGQAIGRGFSRGGERKPTTKEECVRHGAREPRRSVDLPTVVDNHVLRVRQIRIAGRRARVVVSAGALTGVERLTKTADDWRIDSFDLPVRD
jgi:hypothetical protein